MREKRFVIRKYVKAPSAAEAIKRERRQPVDEVYIHEPESSNSGGVSAIGFKAEVEPTWRPDEAMRKR